MGFDPHVRIAMSHPLTGMKGVARGQSPASSLSHRDRMYTEETEHQRWTRTSGQWVAAGIWTGFKVVLEFVALAILGFLLISGFLILA